jgi:hypothetical protein
MDTTGIRQKEIEEIAKPINIATIAGIAPINAFPLSVLLQYMYCDAIFIPDAMRNPIIGSPAHKITLKAGIESFE